MGAIFYSFDPPFSFVPTGHTFEGGEVEAFTFVKSVDYPRDPAGEITAVIHPELQVHDGLEADVKA